jgi:hypothetical protein
MLRQRLAAPGVDSREERGVLFRLIEQQLGPGRPAHQDADDAATQGGPVPRPPREQPFGHPGAIHPAQGGGRGELQGKR